jgi:hypothetical protein
MPDKMTTTKNIMGDCISLFISVSLTVSISLCIAA